MALNFDVSFEQALRQLADTKARLNEVGQLLDKGERSSGKMGSALARSLGQVNTYFRRVEKSLQDSGQHTEALSKRLEEARTSALKTFSEIVSGNTKATIRMSALNGQMDQLGRLMRDTASKNTYTNWLQRTSTLSAEAAGQTQFYRAKLDQLSTAEGVAAVQAAQLARNRTKSLQSMASAASASANYRAIVQQLTDAEREMALTGQRVAWGHERLTSTLASLTAAQQRAKAAIDQANKSMIEGANNLERYTGANAAAEQAAARLAASERSAAAARKREMAELRQDMQERARLRQQEETSYARQANAGAITEHDRERTRVLGQLRAAIEARYAAESGGIKIAERLTRQEAAYQARLERANASIQRRNDLRRAEAAAATTLSSSEARLTQRIREQTAEYQRRAQYMQMTNAQLLGLGRSHDRISRDMHINAQAAAMFRAALGGLHASIGIYTSATVLAASATYALASAFRTGMSAGMEFTETMARADAIMMTSSDSVTTAGRSMEAVTMQVRALGASTLFTSTEVAGGLVDLGMAGLSASEAMTALAPSLNLAAIGSIEMSRAADIATNVMTSFDKTAGQLGHVVDVMATAITNSNTNIEQLANALSYVGPAAQAAGFDLKDTTAAIELLSNSGIKASRAGTGLRRFMLNIQNPTAKGAAVMDRFGISIVNAEGQTRSMTDILGQFNKALHNDAITPAERTAAIMDLVGVRAQSAVASMISSFGQFGVLRRQLEEVDGAAEKMRETMEDVLSMDWRQLKSAFQDIQLDVFTTYEETLRSFTAQARLSLMELQEVNEEMTKMVFSPEQIANGEFVTELDVMIAKVGEAMDAVKGLGIAFLAFKGGNVASTMFASMGANAQSLADRMATLNARSSLLNTTNLSLAGSFRSLTGSVAAHYANIRYATTATERLTGALYSLSTAATYAARGLTMVSAALGWAGMIYGIYTAVTSLFGSDTAKRIQEHGDRVEAAKSRYAELQEQIQKTTEARQRLALVTRRDEAQTEVEGITNRISRLQTTLEMDLDPSSQQRIEDELVRLEQRLDDFRKQALEAGEAIGKVGVNQLQFEQMRSSVTDMAFLLGDARQATDNLDFSSRNINASLGEMASAAQNAAKESGKLNDVMGILSGVMALYSHRIDQTTDAFVPFVEMLQEQLEAQRAVHAEEQRFEGLTTYQQMNELVAQRTELEEDLARRIAEGGDVGADVYERLAEAIFEIEEKILDLGAELTKTWADIADKSKELERLQRNEIETLESLEQQMKNVAAARVAMYAMSAVTGEGVDPDAALKLLEQQIELQTRYNTLQDRENRPSRAPRMSEAEREMQQAVQAFESLRAQYDPLGTASREFNDTQKQLKSLLAANKISTEDYSDAIKHLAKNLQESVEEHSEYYKELKRLRDDYLNESNLSQLFNDRRAVQLLPEGERTVAEHVIENRIKEETFGDLPGTRGIDAAVGGPVGEWANLQAETFAIEEAFNQRIKLFEDYARNDLENREHWASQIHQLEQRKNQTSEMMQTQSQIAMIAMGEQVVGEMANMFQKGSAIQKVMFAAQKAASITQILMHGEVAAMQALATIPPPMNMGVAKSMRVMAGVSAGLVGAQALTSLSTGQTGGTDYAGAYDKGGYIASGKWGVVGEIGPEIVAGPARVTSRKDTAELLGNSGGQTVYSPSIRLDVKVDMSGNQGAATEEMARQEFAMMAQVVEGKVIQILQREMRPRGILDRGRN